MNKVFLSGRLARDCEMRSTQTGIEVCSFTIAVNRRVKKDEPKEADFIDCTAWRERASLINQYFHKGDPITVIGQWRVDKFDDKDGNHRKKDYVLVDEIEFPMSRKSDANGSAPSGEGGTFTETDPGELPF